jgi:flagellar biosynthesis/type III secretory pathway chaperone
MARDCPPGAELCRDHLQTLLSDETAALQELERLLQAEHAVLAAQNVAAIERIALTRQEKIGALAQIEAQRRGLCTLHGFSADWLGLEGLLQWCDPEGSLLPRLRECAQLAVRCRDFNDRNGTLVGARLRQVQSMLATLGVQGAKPDGYDPKGSATKHGYKRELGAA